MLAIHKNNEGFTKRWVSYCSENGISFTLVNCYDDNIIDQLKEFKALLWHFSQNSAKDIIIAKQILFALEHTGFKIFPDFRTAWHFDDKVGQKYLLERSGCPMVRSYAFYDKEKALQWASTISYPKVWKLRGGAGSANVQLVKSERKARSKINRAFGPGFLSYDPWGSLKERIRKFQFGKSGLIDLTKGIARFFYPPDFARVNGRQRGYIYFQDFIPDNDSDIRIIVVDQKAFALKRYVRRGDFRASGSGSFGYAKELFDERCVRIALETAQKLGTQSIAFDFVFNEEDNPLVVEISYGFSPHGYDDCPGYWDAEMNWHQGPFNPYGWMIEALLRD